MKVYLYIPRWFYPNNLGDSIHSYFAPKVIKNKNPGCTLEVVTSGPLMDLMVLNPYVDSVREPSPFEVQGRDQWKTFGHGPNPRPDIFTLFAEWHPRVWDFWNDNFDYLAEHKTANILTVNSLLQMGYEDLLFENFDFHSPVDMHMPPREEKTLGIVPMTKLSGKPTPHRGCDGQGFRFNGDQGESWRTFVDRIKDRDESIHIIEYSPKNLGLGDEHVGELPWPQLLRQVSRPTVSVMTDGGLHHAFNLVESPLVFLASQQVSKETHLMLHNGRFYPELHQGCMSKCYNTLQTIQAWDGLDSVCDKACQKVDPTHLAEKVFKDYFYE